MGSKTTLVIMFNHPYVSNISKIKNIYRDRFDDIVFLVPFIKIDDPDVVTVYRGSFNFHGYVTEALSLLKSRRSDLYIFCHDDVLLNPDITPQKFWDSMNFDTCDGFITDPHRFLCSPRNDWAWTERVRSRLMEPLAHFSGSGVESILDYLPPRDVAEACFTRYGLGRSSTESTGDADEVQLPYPLAVTYADFFALRGDVLESVAHLLGIFAGIDLFVEVSVGTAMIIACRKLVFISDSPWKAVIDWTDRSKLLSEGSKSIADICKNFDPDLLFNHPIKLSLVSI